MKTNDKPARYIFRDEIYFTIEQVDEAICEHIYDVYPEEVHSDYLPEETALFEELWEEVERIW